MEKQRLEIRKLSTGNWVALDRDDRKVYLMVEDVEPDAEATREDLQELARRGEAIAIDRNALVSLYDEFTRIAVLG
jgi:hypothetical protein